MIFATSSSSVRSENEQFSAQIVQADDSNVLVEVYRNDPDSRTLLWSAPIDHDSASSPMAAFVPTMGSFAPTTFLLSNDGQAVVMRDGISYGDEQIFLITKSGRKTFSSAEISKLLGIEMPSFDQEVADPSTMQAFFEGIGAVQAGFELLLTLENRTYYCAWMPQQSAWLLGNFADLTLTKPDRARQQQISRLARERALQLIRKHQPGGVAQALQSLRSKAASVLPGFDQVNDSSLSLYQAEEAYAFIASLRNPADKKYLDQLLAWPIEGLQDIDSLLSGQFVSEERAIGDQLLARWNGLTNQTEFPALSYGIYISGQLHYLAGVHGTIELPIPVPDENGDLFLYLIPAHLPEDKWQQNSSVLAFLIRLHDPTTTAPFPVSMPDSMKGAETIPFALSTLTPGDYRIQAVWDRRPPYANPQERGWPFPGDYTSAEIPVKLTAGGRLEDLRIDCTNRVGEAAQYYAADDAWKKLGPQIQATREMEAEMNHDGEKVLFTAPLAEWFPATNQSPRGMFTGIRIVQPLGEPRSLLKISHREDLQDFQAMRMFSIVDEHGCEFGMNMSSGSISEMSEYFPVYPRTADEFVLLIKDTRFDLNRPAAPQEKETRVTIKNLQPVQRADWRADPLPAKRDLDLVSVAYTGYSHSHMREQFQFTRNGKPVHGWFGRFTGYEDSQGNYGTHLLALCRKETLFKVRARFSREQTADFSEDETWILTLPEIPAPGKHLVLSLEKTLQGVRIQLLALTGTGEFTYLGDEILSGQAAIEDSVNPFGGRFYFHGAMEVPKVHEKMGPSGPFHTSFSGFGSPRPQKRTIVSRVPHIAVRLTGLTELHEWKLLESDSTPSFAFGSSPHNEIQHLPLNYEPGTKNPRLTFQVQKALEANFIVHIPERPQSDDEIDFSQFATP